MPTILERAIDNYKEKNLPYLESRLLKPLKEGEKRIMVSCMGSPCNPDPNLWVYQFLVKIGLANEKSQCPRKNEYSVFTLNETGVAAAREVKPKYEKGTQPGGPTG